MQTANPFADLIPFQLCIRARPGGLPELIAAIDRALSDGWRRDREREEKLHVSLRPWVTCYRCDQSDGRPPVMLVLHRFGEDLLRDGDVIFADRGVERDLTKEERDGVLFNFHDNVLCKLPADSCVAFAIGVDRG